MGEIICEEDIIDRENVKNFLVNLGNQCDADVAFVVLRRNGTVDALWYGDPLIINSMAQLGKEAIWKTVIGDVNPGEHPIDDSSKNKDWDINDVM